jgi:Lipocalin-like domain
MTRRIILGISVAPTVGLLFLAGLAVAQKQSLSEQLVGTWLVVAVDNIRRDGSRFQSLGPNPKGILMFDANGWFSFQLAQPARPKFASDNRLQGTAEENKATVQGSLSYYGKYSVEEADRVLHLYIEASSWPNSPAKPPALPERIEAVLQLRELGRSITTISLGEPRGPQGDRNVTGS